MDQGLALPTSQGSFKLQVECSSALQVSGDFANPKIFWTLPIFPHSPMMIIFLDGQSVKGLVDMGADATILTEAEALCFPQWKFKPGLSISGHGNQQDSKIITHPVHWKDLCGNREAIHPIISTVPRNLWGRDILEDLGAVLTTNDRSFFDDAVVHEKKWAFLAKNQSNTPNSKGHCPSNVQCY